MEPGSPFGSSIQSLATYLRYTHAISYERLSQLFSQVFGLEISEGAIANLFETVKTRLDDQPTIKKLLLRAFVIHRRRERICASTLYQYRCDLKRRLAKALDLKPDHDDGIRLRKRYGSIKDHLFVFLEDASIPPTNNSSEQAIRMSTVFDLYKSRK